MKNEIAELLLIDATESFDAAPEEAHTRRPAPNRHNADGRHAAGAKTTNTTAPTDATYTGEATVAVLLANGTQLVCAVRSSSSTATIDGDARLAAREMIAEAGLAHLALHPLHYSASTSA